LKIIGALKKRHLNDLAGPLFSFMLTCIVGGIVGCIVGCSPSPEQLKKTLQAHPEILHAAIEADPKGFFDIVQKVQARAREQAEAEQINTEYQRVADDLKTPKEVEISKDRPMLGDEKAPVTIVEWSDFNCGHCAHAEETLAKLSQEYAGKVRITYKHLPILAKESRTAAEFYEAISLQDKAMALKFHDLLFARQGEFRQGGEEFLKKATKEVGANVSKVERDRKTAAIKSRIESDVDEAKKFEFTGTPGFMVNGAPVRGAYPYEFFKKVIDGILSGSNANATSAPKTAAAEAAPAKEAPAAKDAPAAAPAGEPAAKPEEKKAEEKKDGA
jgi:protein-disulfide isomerase